MSTMSGHNKNACGSILVHADSQQGYDTGFRILGLRSFHFHGSKKTDN